MKFFLMILLCFFPISTLLAQDISGVYSTEWGNVTFTQDGAAVTGSYPLNNGRIEGTLKGRVLTGRWHQSNGSGRIIFEFNSDLSAFTGKWGRGDAEPLSAWNGSKISSPVVVAGVYSTEWGNITFAQQGSTVTGSYPLNNGRIEGTLNGRVLTGRWHQSNGSGRIIFEFNSDLSAFTGKWSRGDAEPLSAWNGTRVKP